MSAHVAQAVRVDVLPYFVEFYFAFEICWIYHVVVCFLDWQIYKLFDNRDVDPDFLSFVREQDDFTLLVMVPEGVAPEGDGHVALFLWPQFFECHVHFQMVGDLHLGDADGLFLLRFPPVGRSRGNRRNVPERTL